MSDHILLDAADYLIGVLTGLTGLDAVRLFIRGSAPQPVGLDRHPYIEVDLDEEQPGEEIVGEASLQTYTGQINVYMSSGAGISGGDWLDIVDRVSRVPSQDKVLALMNAITDELGKYEHRALGNMVWTNGVHTEAVLKFSLGVRSYGLDNRTENISNYGSVEVSIETERARI